MPVTIALVVPFVFVHLPQGDMVLRGRGSLGLLCLKEGHRVPTPLRRFALQFERFKRFLVVELRPGMMEGGARMGGGEAGGEVKGGLGNEMEDWVKS